MTPKVHSRVRGQIRCFLEQEAYISVLAGPQQIKQTLVCGLSTTVLKLNPYTANRRTHEQTKTHCDSVFLFYFPALKAHTVL